MDSKTSAYYAGIVDGEGCITFYQHAGLPGFVFTLNMTDPLVVTDLAERYGVSFSVNRNKKHDNWKPYYSVSLCSSNFLDFLRHVRPFLKMKAQQADIVLHCDMSSRSDRIAAMAELRKLNRRGSDGNTNTEGAESGERPRLQT